MLVRSIRIISTLNEHRLKPADRAAAELPPQVHAEHPSHKGPSAVVCRLTVEIEVNGQTVDVLQGMCAAAHLKRPRSGQRGG